MRIIYDKSAEMNTNEIKQGAGGEGMVEDESGK